MMLVTKIVPPKFHHVSFYIFMVAKEIAMLL